MRQCEHIRHILLEAADGALPGEEMSVVEEHLAGCAQCRSEYLRLKRASEALRETVLVIAPPTSHLTTRRRERLYGRMARRRAPIRLITWRRFVAAAAIAAIIASAPFIISDLRQYRRSSALPPIAVESPPPASHVAVMLGVGVRPGRRSVEFAPVDFGSSRPYEAALPTGRLIGADTAGISVPVSHPFYESEESSHWW